MSRVFIVQDQKRVDDNTGELKSKFDFKEAQKRGELHFLLKSNSSPFNLSPVLEQLHEKLSDFNDDDYLLLTGNPVLLGMSVAIAADYNEGNVRLLQWSGAKKTYIPVQVRDLFIPCAQKM